MSFGFDPSIILSGAKGPEAPAPNETLALLSNLASQRGQQEHVQAQLADLARQQQQQQQLSGIYSANADATPEARARALMLGGFGQQAYAEQDQASQMQSQTATRAKLFADLQDAHRKKIGDLFYGTKDKADYAARVQQLASDPDKSIAAYAPFLPTEYDPGVTERLGNMAVPAVERAKLAARGNGAGQVITGEDGTQYVADKQTGAATTVKDEHGNAIKARPKGKGGGAGGAGGGGPADQLSPEAIDAMAQKFKATGELTGLGTGKSALGLKVKIMNRAMELNPGSDLAGNKAAYAADSKSLAKLQTTADAVDAFEATAEKNLDNFTGLAQKLRDTGSPWLNAPARKFDEEVAGNPDMAGIGAARATAIAEIGKVLSGQTGGGGLTEGARKEVEELIKPGATLAQIMSAASVLKQDMHNRKAAVQDQLKEMRGRISGKGAAKEGGSAGGAKAHPQDSEAVAWARGALKADPNNEDAKQILKANGVQ